MRAYQAYFDRQKISGAAHKNLLAMEPQRVSPWGKWATAAVCLVVAVGLGAVLFKMSQQAYVPAAEKAAHSAGAAAEGAPAEKAPADEEAAADTSKSWVISYPERTEYTAVDYAWPEGGFDVELTGEQVREVLRVDEDEELAVLDGYTLHGRAMYDGRGDLWLMSLFGERGEKERFSIDLAPGKMPPCCVQPLETFSEVNGVKLNTWSDSYDRDGDGEIEYLAGSEFMTGDVGMRLENTGSLLRSSNIVLRSNGSLEVGDETVAVSDAMEFNALLTLHCLEKGLDLEELLRCEHIPAWENESYSAYEEAAEEWPFSLYLPENDPFPQAYEFNGGRSYQELRYHTLWMSWSDGGGFLGDLRVELPEGGELPYVPVDVEKPESYDARLYFLPWADSVPAEYLVNFMSATFRAEDMSPEIVKARCWETDEHEKRWCFQVLHENGVLAAYDFYGRSGLTDEDVWAMVEPSLLIGTAPDEEQGGDEEETVFLRQFVKVEEASEKDAEPASSQWQTWACGTTTVSSAGSGRSVYRGVPAAGTNVKDCGPAFRKTIACPTGTVAVPLSKNGWKTYSVVSAAGTEVKECKSVPRKTTFLFG